MKKAIQLFSIASCVVLSMIACQSNENKPTTTATETTSAAVTPTPTVAPSNTTAPTTATAPTPTTVTPTTKATVEPIKVAPVPTKDLTTKGSTPAASTTPTTPNVAKSAIVKWDETVHNWGSIKQGEKMTHVFKFKNTGSEPLIILDAKGSCGCTVPEKPAAPIGPGKTGEIKVVFDSNGKEGPQTKIVTVTANTEPSNFALTIKGDVKKD
jgi:hypothetical protein